MNSKPQLGAVLLAAGAAIRMGERPKCLLTLDGVPLIECVLNALSKGGVQKVVVVLGHYADQIEPFLKNHKVQVIRNSKADEGQVSSLRLGLQALPSSVEVVIVALADQPLITQISISDLINAFEKRPANTEVVVPYVNNLPGNPVIFTSQVSQSVLAGDANYGIKQWRQIHRAKVHHWENLNEAYRTDVDTPEDIDGLFHRTGHRLLWGVGDRSE